MGGLATFVENLSGAKITVVKKEPPTGATVYRLDGTAVQPGARFRGESVQAIETTGLGDAFIAGWITALLDGVTSLRDRVERAHEVACLCATRVGGTLPSAERDGGVESS